MKMSVFKRKRTVTDANGKKQVKRSACWYIEFKDHDGKVRRVKGYRDLAATRQKAAELERHAERCDAGLADQFAEHKKRQLSEHIEDFRRSLAVGNSESHVRITLSRIKRVFDGCGFCFWGDIQGNKIIGFLDHLKKRNGEKISNKTFNHYLTSVRMFCTWMVREQRAGESPVGHLKRLRTTEADRRPLDCDEVCRLLAATEKAPYRFGMPGHERAVLYLVGIETGLRVRELQSLTVNSFDFDDAAVTVKAEHCKNGQKAVQLLKYNRAAQLREFFAGKLPGAKAFNVPSHYRTAKMLHADCEAAEIPVVDDAGRKIVFHSTRHPLATELDRSGASLKERMTILRHSDRGNLSLGTYCHIQTYDIRRAIEKLPDYPWPGTEAAEAVATGTDGRPISTDKPLTGKWTGKRTGTAYPDSASMSSTGTPGESTERIPTGAANTHKGLNAVALVTEERPLSPPVNVSDETGPARIRTLDQWIMSPLLYR
jgi:site-specific recombinase XerD